MMRRWVSVLLAVFAAPLSANGPDRGGYRWMDSDTAGGPAFDWLEITGSGTRLVLGDDDNLGPFGLGFVSDFYGHAQESVRVCSNGWLSFKSSSHQFHHFGIPDARDPNALLAPLWADLDPSQGGSVYYLSDSAHGRFVVSWVGVPLHGSGDSCTFQAVLDSSGAVAFQYLRVPASVRLGADSSTVGIEDDSGLVGLEYVRDGVPERNRLHDSLAIRFFRLQRDACAEAILRPVGQVFVNDSIAPLVLVWNAGLSPASFPVTLRIGGEYEQTLVVSGLGALRDTVLGFPVWVPGADTVQAELATGLAGDEFPANDTLRRAVAASWFGELGYDDGWQEEWFLKNGAPTTDWAAAVRYSVPYGEFRLRGARLFVADTMMFSRVLVCPDSGGAPRLASPYLAVESVRTSRPEAWLDVPADVPVSSADDLWLVAFWPRRAAGPRIGEDRDLPIDGRTYYGSPTVRWFLYDDGDLLARLVIDGRTGIAELAPSGRARFSANPNPFRTRTAISFPASRIQGAEEPRIRVYDASGRCVRKLRAHGAGREACSVLWDGTDDSGRRLSSGTYFIRIDSESVSGLARATMFR